MSVSEEPARTALKGGRSWRIGTDTDVNWINTQTTTQRSITSAIPPIFEDYATVTLPVPDGYAVTISSSGGGVAHIVQPELDQGVEPLAGGPTRPSGPRGVAASRDLSAVVAGVPRHRR